MRKKNRMVLCFFLQKNERVSEWSTEWQNVKNMAARRLASDIKEKMPTQGG